MRTVVFYSYKGGTGRTLTLANIARFAARIASLMLAEAERVRGGP